MHHSERGSVTLMASLFIIAFVALYLHALTKILWADKKIKERKHAYLCFKYQVVLMKNYVGRMGRINQALKINFWLQMNPKTAAMAKMIHKAALTFQKIIHGQYAYNRSNNSYCSKKDSLPFVFSPPYLEKGFFLVRNGDGTSKVRRPKWKILYLYGNIALSASLGPLGALENYLKITTKEVW